MVFCRQCGKSVEGGRFCSACGGPIAPDAVNAMATKLKRYRNEMLLILVALGLVFAVAAGLIVCRVMRTERAASGSSPSGASSAPVTRLQQPLPTSPAAAQTLPGQPQQQPPQTTVSGEKNPSSLPSTGSISQKEVQNEFSTLSKKEKPREPSPQPMPSSSAASSGSDRYPGSEPLEVNANLPDIGVPVTSEVYTTTDSLATVVAYYTERYSDAEVTEVNGQKIIAVDRTGASKVIAIGTTGEETRISIVKQAK
jgi:hypothetical protein